MAFRKGNRIREKKAVHYQGKEIYYTPKCYHAPGNMKLAVRAHEYLWDESGWLSEADKKIVSSRWLANVVGEMASLTRWTVKEARGIFDSYYPKLDSPEFTLSPSDFQKFLRESQKPKESGQPTQNDLERVIELNLKNKSGKMVRTFPGHDRNQEGAKALMDELLLTGSLMEDKAKKIPKQAYQEYRKDISKRDCHKLSAKVTKVQTLIQWGKLWKSFFESKGVQSIKEVDATHVEEYQNWRDSHKSMNAGKPISVESLKGELSFFRSLYKFAVIKELAPSHRLLAIEDVKPIGSSDGKKEEKPIPIKRILEVIAHARKSYLECPTSNQKEKMWRLSRKQNWLALICLAVTGCRPDEINLLDLSIDKDEIFIKGEKTDKAKRSFKILPTFYEVLSENDFRTLSGDIARRLNQWLERNGFEDITPYRFRHTVATISMILEPENHALIADRLGHTSSKFTKDRYTNSGSYLLKDTGR
ncbi:MAG TPA: hypothetical protein VJ385_23335, partial [Fibrobacteria bacterium]|nr:hypothetical protein [Fibrobacteria bacterium]